MFDDNNNNNNNNNNKNNNNNNNIMTITFTIHMFLSELKDILTCLEDDGIRAMFTDSKAQYHHSIRKVNNV